MDQVAFAHFVRRAVDRAKDQRGWSVTRLATETGVGRSTLFRWLGGDGQEYPELATLRGFCAALDIPVDAAFTALGMRDTDPDAESAARADAERVLARLADPSTAEAEKTVIRDMLRYLASPATPAIAS